MSAHAEAELLLVLRTPWTQWASRWVDDLAAQFYFSCRPNVQSSLGIQLVALELNFEYVRRVAEDKMCEIELVWLLATLSNIFDFPLTLAFWNLILELVVFKNKLTLCLCKAQLDMTFGIKNSTLKQ